MQRLLKEPVITFRTIGEGEWSEWEHNSHTPGAGQWGILPGCERCECTVRAGIRGRRQQRGHFSLKTNILAHGFVCAGGGHHRYVKTCMSLVCDLACLPYMP